MISTATIQLCGCSVRAARGYPQWMGQGCVPQKPPFLDTGTWIPALYVSQNTTFNFRLNHLNTQPSPQALQNQAGAYDF